MKTIIRFIVNLVARLWISEPRRVVIPSIWQTLEKNWTEPPVRTSIDIKLRGMFVAEVVCEWRGAFFSGVMRPARVYLLDEVQDILRLLKSPPGPEAPYTCSLGKEIKLVRIKEIDFTDQAPDLG